jgi:predicted transcriptional regulator
MKTIFYTDCRACGGTGREISHIETGKKMRQLRTDADISLREVARRLGISGAYLSDMEQGKRNWTNAKVEMFLGAVKGKQK